MQFLQTIILIIIFSTYAFIAITFMFQIILLQLKLINNTIILNTEPQQGQYLHVRYFTVRTSAPLVPLVITTDAQ